MALQKTNVPISITDGVDTKTDSKNVLATKFLEVVNGDYTHTGALSKRSGFDALPRTTNLDEIITSAKALATFNQELLMFSNNNLYTFSEANDSWVNKGSSILANVSDQMIYSEPRNILSLSQGYIGKYQLTVYVEFAGITLLLKNLTYILTDTETNTILSRHSFNPASGYARPRVAVMGNNFVVFYVDTQNNQLKYFTVNTVNYAAPGPLTVVDSSNNSNFYTLSTVNRIYFIYQTPGLAINIAYFSTGMVQSSSVVLDTGGLLASSCISLENGKIRVATSTGRAKFFLLSPDLNTQLHTPVLGDNTSTASVRTIQDPANANRSLVVYGDSAVGLASVSSTGIFVNPTTYQWLNYSSHSDLVEKDGEIFFLITRFPTNKNQLASTYLVNYSKGIVASLSVDNVYINSTTAASYKFDPQTLLKKDSDTIVAPIVEFAEATDGFSYARPAIPTKAVNKIIGLNKYDNYFSVEAANNTLFSGGVMKMYDGNLVVEQGFLQVPDSPSITPGLPVVEVDPGLTGGKSYQYAVVFAWRDRFGQIHRSTPSFSTAQVIGSAPNFYSWEVQVPCISLTMKSNVELELYRTTGDGTLYHKITGGVSGSTITNDPTNPYVTFIDDYSDVAIETGEILYTQGGEIENNAPEVSKYVCNYKARVFSLLSDGKRLQYSKIIQYLKPVEFSGLFIIELDSFGGKGTCLIQLDDNLVIFKEQAIYAMNGEGPNNLGEQDDFRKPQLISSDAGCIDPNSVVMTDSGVFFKSSKGIYLLSRNLSVSYVGAGVEAFNDLTITSATLLANTNQVRFTTSSGVVLVYDYFHARWSWYEGLEFEDSLIYKNKFTAVKSTGFVFQQSSDFKDVDTHIPMSLASSWIQLAGIQGYERFYRLLILGTYKGAHKLRVQFAFNFNEAWTEETVIEVTGILAPETYGDDAVYGDSEVYGGPASLYQFEIRPKRQKCQSFKFRISDYQDGAVIGESMRLSNFALEVGVKQGHNKVGKNKASGT